MGLMGCLPPWEGLPHKVYPPTVAWAYGVAFDAVVFSVGGFFRAALLPLKFSLERYYYPLSFLCVCLRALEFAVVL